MSYTALYRKWRPLSFDDVKGQDHIVKALKNQINSERIGHAYLFCGTRGTGKTSIAKILARAVNCEHPVDGSPCGECASCKTIFAGASMNVVEIDAASNNGVDNIREIREEVQYSPAEGKYRVYIIDEVHMLSTGAFNALLKTLEEPPSYVIFILATTEAHKIPVTVLSRCQRYDFHRIEGDTVFARLNEMAQAEGIDAEEKAIRYIARKGDGSMRDAISLFEQCAAFYYGECLTYEKVLEVLGAVDNEIFSNLLRIIARGETARCMVQVEELILQGRELGQFVIDFIWYMRNLLLIQSTDIQEDLFDMTAEDMQRMQEEKTMVDTDTLMRYIRVLSELSNQMRYASGKRVLLEIALIKLTRPQMEQNLDSILQRLSVIERQLEEGVKIPVTQAAGEKLPETNANEEVLSEANEVKTLPKAQYEDLRTIRNNWPKITKDLGMALRPAFAGARVEPFGEGTLVITFDNEMNYEIASREPVLEQLKDYVEKKYGKKIDFQTRLARHGEPRIEYISEEELHQKIKMDIIVENS